MTMYFQVHLEFCFIEMAPWKQAKDHQFRKKYIPMECPP